MLAGGGKATPIPAGLERAVAWIVARDRFTETELAESFAALAAESQGELLRSLAAMKAIPAG
ncbi:MAG: hypothetical protein ACK4NA_13495 [Alphaproteobacteria bacterium]